MEISLSGVIMENSSPEEESELLDSLVSSIGNSIFYERIHQPGRIYNDILTWIAIINVVGSTLTIGQVLWVAYKKITSIKKSKDPKSNPKLLFQFRDANNEFVQIVLGEDLRTEEEFLPEFQRKMEIFIKQSKSGQISINNKYEESISWKKVKSKKQ